MEAPSRNLADIAGELDGLANRIYAVRTQRWHTDNPAGHGVFMAQKRDALREIGTDLSHIMVELIDLWPVARQSRQQRARHERLMRFILQWMATCDVPMTGPWLRAYRSLPHRFSDRLRAYMAYCRGRVSYFIDDGVIPR